MVGKILTECYEDGIIRGILDNMKIPSTYIDDLEQEVYMILLEYDKDKIVELYERKQLKYFIVGIITRQYNSKTSPFYKKYKKYYQYIDGNYVNNEDVEEDNEFD
jgi:hypothetical protein